MSPLTKATTAARVRIPADVEREDRLLGNLTARQLAILACGGVVLWALYSVTAHVVALPVFAALAAPLAALVVAMALGRVGGVSADRVALAAWRHHRSPHRLVPAPDGVPVPSASFAGLSGPAPAALALPLLAVADDGIVDLEGGAMAVVCRASSVPFALRTAAEQEGLVDAFGRYLNSLSEPVQFVIRAEPIDLAPLVSALEMAAPALPHPGLEDAALAHARFLGELAETRDLLRRQVLVVLHQSPGEGARERLARRAEEAVVSLAGAGVTLTVLGGHEVGAVLERALDPAAPARPRRSFTEVVTRSGHGSDLRRQVGFADCDLGDEARRNDERRRT